MKITAPLLHPMVKFIMRYPSSVNVEAAMGDTLDRASTMSTDRISPPPVSDVLYRHNVCQMGFKVKMLGCSIRADLIRECPMETSDDCDRLKSSMSPVLTAGETSVVDVIVPIAA